MSDSIDAANRRTSEFGAKSKISRKGAHNGDAGDTPALREARIQAYMNNVWVFPDDSASKVVRVGSNGNPLNVFSGDEYSDDELEVLEVEGEE